MQDSDDASVLLGHHCVELHAAAVKRTAENIELKLQRNEARDELQQQRAMWLQRETELQQQLAHWQAQAEMERQLREREQAQSEETAAAKDAEWRRQVAAIDATLHWLLTIIFTPQQLQSLRRGQLRQQDGDSAQQQQQEAGQEQSWTANEPAQQPDEAGKTADNTVLHVPGSALTQDSKPATATLSSEPAEDKQQQQRGASSSSPLSPVPIPSSVPQLPCSSTSWAAAEETADFRPVAQSAFLAALAEEEEEQQSAAISPLSAAAAEDEARPAAAASSAECRASCPPVLHLRASLPARADCCCVLNAHHLSPSSPASSSSRSVHARHTLSYIA